jgi:hypothetical protein
MSLVLKPNADASADDYHVLHGELRIGQIYKRKVALQAETQWLWALNGVPECPNGPAVAGLAAGLDEAMAALNERWAKWLASAGLTEATRPEPDLD